MFPSLSPLYACPRSPSPNWLFLRLWLKCAVKSFLGLLRPTKTSYEANSKTRSEHFSHSVERGIPTPIQAGPFANFSSWPVVLHKVSSVCCVPSLCQKLQLLALLRLSDCRLSTHRRTLRPDAASPATWPCLRSRPSTQSVAATRILPSHPCSERCNIVNDVVTNCAIDAKLCVFRTTHKNGGYNG